ncbi:hypothetical protein RSOLAG22IIIB_12332 [Rhizoctonia solani]|uniref:Uncharacterized protein n=1 Tax=Rhizoctonia solani TaxID=456999 RepID=A0A0K6GD13_9AGAM|nr:hypothetical protein RSOLAG22IIIB_12332 [Rhizoctonia solani]
MRTRTPSTPLDTRWFSRLLSHDFRVPSINSKSEHPRQSNNGHDAKLIPHLHNLAPAAHIFKLAWLYVSARNLSAPVFEFSSRGRRCGSGRSEDLKSRPPVNSGLTTCHIMNFNCLPPWLEDSVSMLRQFDGKTSFRLRNHLARPAITPSSHCDLARTRHAQYNSIINPPTNHLLVPGEAAPCTRFVPV